MSYIEKETLVLDVKRYLLPNVDNDGTITVENAERAFLSLIEKQPVIEGKLVKQGEWIIHFKDGTWYYDCPFCEDGYATQRRPKFAHTHHCSNCGAELVEKRGEIDNEEN